MKKTILPGRIGLLLLIMLSCSWLSPDASTAQTTQINPVIDSSLPTNEPHVIFQDVLLIPGAFSGKAVGHSYSYLIRATVKEVQDYYLREMPLAGWELEDQTGDADIGETSIRLRYHKGEETVAIFIHPAEDKDGLVEVTFL